MYYAAEDIDEAQFVDNMWFWQIQIMCIPFPQYFLSTVYVRPG